MTPFRSRIVEEARSWIGTPYVHQAATKRAGTDCLGLIRGIWRHVVGTEPETVPPYTQDWAEPGRQEVLWDAAQRWMIPKDPAKAEPGDVLLFRLRDGVIAKHLAVLTAGGDVPYFIHAYNGHGVVESALSAPWKRRVVACFEFPMEGS